MPKKCLIAKAQRKLAKKKKGSNNFNKQKRVVAQIHEKIANSRKDFTQKMTTKLVNDCPSSLTKYNASHIAVIIFIKRK